MFGIRAGRRLAIVGTCLLFNCAVLTTAAMAGGRLNVSKVELPHDIAPMGDSALSGQHAMGVDQEIAVSPWSERNTAVILFDEDKSGGPVKFRFPASAGGAQTSVNGSVGSP